MVGIVEQKTKEYLEASFEKVQSELEACKSDFGFMRQPQRINEFPRYIRALQNCLSSVKRIIPQYDMLKVRESLAKYYDEACLQHEYKVAALNEEYERRLDNIENTIIEQARDYNNSLKEQLDSDNQIYLDLEEKRKQLEVYENDVLDVCSLYGITTSDITVSNASFTVEELDEVYDQYIAYMKRSKKTVNPITKFRDLIRDNTVVEGITLLLVLIIAFTTIFDCIAILFYLVVIVSQLRVKTKVKSYSILLGLLYNIRPLEMGFKACVNSDELMPEDIDEEEAPELQVFAAEWENALAELEEKNPKTDMEKVLQEFDSQKDSIELLFKERQAAFKKEQEGLMTKLSETIDKAKSDFEEAKSKIVKLGDAITENIWLDTEFKLGLDEGVLELSYDVGLQNIIIQPGGDKNATKDFIQLLFANALCNVKAGQLEVIVFDPYNFGQDLVAFYHEEFENLIKFETNQLDSVLKPLKSYAEANLKTMRGLDINQYNREAAEIGKTPKGYKLLVVLSEPKTFEENEALKSFMAYSAKLGVIIWLVSNITLPDTKIYRKPFDGIASPYRTDMKDLANRTVRSLVTALKEGKVSSIDWKTDTVPIICPDDKIWTWHADKYVELDPGFWEGDPTRADGYTIGHDGNVHALIVGTSGTGKSVFINQLIMNAARKYSPRDLELWLVDYKGSEFAFYLPTEDHPKVLPHIKACLCTSDGEYAGSLFKALRAEAERRYKYIIATGFKSIYEYNQQVRKGCVYEYVDEDGVKRYTSNPKFKSDMRQLDENDLVSRIVFINDEFQVIFEKADSKTVEQITKDITYIGKVARAAGVHVVFASQSMKGTVKKDTLDQFTLRFALRCDVEVSQDILGTKFAGEIVEPYGYLYVRSQGDKSLTAQKKYRTPFAKSSDLRNEINSLADRAIAEGYPKHDLITYDESIKRNIRELNEFYDSMTEQPPEGLVVLGESMTYSDNKAPENIVLSAANNMNVLASFSDTRDIVNFYRTLRNNLERNKTGQIFVNSQVSDFHYVCEIEKDVDESELIFTTEKTSIEKLIDLFVKVYAMRKEAEKKDEPLYYILIGWDKAVGFGIDRDYDLTTMFGNMLQVCGEYNMHFIFITNTAKPIPAPIQSACKFKICGKCDEETSYALLNSKLGSQVDDTLSNGYLYLNCEGTISRCKIYQTKIEREIKSSKLML